MATDRLERQQALNTIAQLKEQHRQLQSEQQEADRMSQHIFQLDNQVAGLAASNDELSTDLGRALDVAQRVMEQKQALQEQVKVQEQQLTQWQAEGHRVKELEGGLRQPFASCGKVSLLLQNAGLCEILCRHG